jgi:hypothetical protein
MDSQNTRRAVFGLGSITVLFVGLFTALTLASTTGAMATAFTAVFFEPSVRQLGSYICPEGTEVNYYSVRYSYHEPGESEPHVECVRPDGSVQDVTMRALATTVGGSFVGGFLICCIPISLGALLLALVLGRQAAKKSSPTPPAAGGPKIERLG